MGNWAAVQAGWSLEGIADTLVILSYPTLPTPIWSRNTKPSRDCADDVAVIVKQTFMSHVLFSSCLLRIHQEISYKAGLIFFTLLI